MISNLQKRLLSSIAAFDRTLQVHRNTLEKRAAKAGKQRQVRLDSLDLLQNAIDGDDERAGGDEDELLQEADAQHEAALSWPSRHRPSGSSAPDAGDRPGALPGRQPGTPGKFDP